MFSQAEGPKNSISVKSFAISLSILLVTIASIAAISLRKEPVVLKTNLEKIPMVISGLKGTDDAFPESVYKALNAQLHVYRHYQSTEGRQIDLYIGYYGTARGGRTGHNPVSCFSGAGWEFIELKKEKLACSYQKNGAKVNYLLLHKGGIYQIVFHWYQSSGTKILDSGFEQNIQRFIARVLYNRNDGAFIRVSVSTNREGIENATLLARHFAESILDLLPQFWPVEQ